MNKLQEELQKYGQEHLLIFYDKLEEKEQKKLLNQISKINFENIKELYNNINHQKEDKKRIEPIEFLDKYKIEENEYKKYKNIGEEELRKGKLAVITMAGGQGTRLRT